MDGHPVLIELVNPEGISKVSHLHFIVVLNLILLNHPYGSIQQEFNKHQSMYQ